jgi:hypothetical protein
MNTKQFAYDMNSGEYVYRIPGARHGDGQIDSDESPVWLTTTQQEAEAGCDGEVPNVKL